MAREWGLIRGLAAGILVAGLGLLGMKYLGGIRWGNPVTRMGLGVLHVGLYLGLGVVRLGDCLCRRLGQWL